MFLTTAALCLAANIYFEARGEPLKGQVAVAQVTMNRAGHDPDRVCDEVLKPKQFSWTTKLVGQDARLKPRAHPQEEKAWALAKMIAQLALIGALMVDVTHGATHYHAKSVTPYWSKAYPRVASIGSHIFYRNK